ncbi:hypothetical protein DXT99_05000 [Pontibacter diazotrophicus]|uniref:DUF6705 domain-containing protein n=1 Tax=Pontibacter diazotrophicus TaxID=1400979 RepID=A0A3D8LGK4_9BACT|nr:DUF6705 family protein [Pontibacter diazotrophicus]RDV16553.1 hypothetical protein DXT99_05000 [Pontibacter diazotrophicus]
MKKLLTIVILAFLCALNAVAQDSRPYTEVPELDKFAGEWVYSNKGESLTLFLTKEKTYVETINSYVDALAGFYEYKPDKSSSLGNKDKNKIIAGRLVAINGDAATFLIIDSGKNKPGQATLEFMPNSFKQAKLDIMELEGVKVKKKTSTSGFSLPSGIILKKVN